MQWSNRWLAGAPPGSTHDISENASDADSASLLAIFVADDGAPLSRGVPEK